MTQSLSVEKAPQEQGHPGVSGPATHARPEAPPQPTPAESESRSRAGRRLLVVVVLAVVVLGGAFAVGALPRLRQQQQLDTAAAATAAQPPRVTVVVAKRRAAVAERVLPGNSLPLFEAALYGRATGYVKTRLVDIGDRVEKGQLLAEISAPDVDDQLAQAKANLEQARANLKLYEAEAILAKTTLTRSLRIAGSSPAAVSQQEIDRERSKVGTSEAGVATAKATIQVNKAAVQRYTDLQAFEKITAPFKGVITARNIDPGDLVTADSTVRELFHVMRTDVLRVFVNVPQVFATAIQVGQSADVYRREDPAITHKGKVTRTADALSSNSRTLLTEVQVRNPDNALRAGMYLQVRFRFDRKVFPVLIPAAALATRTGAPRVAVLDAQKKVRYRDVQLGRDYGAEIEVAAGLKEGETVVVHPGDDLAEGTVVEPVPMPKSGTGP